MPQSTREPATKFFGPNHRFGDVDPELRVRVQLHNLEPGEFWQPALEAELLTSRVLSPLFDNIVYRYVGTNFIYRWHYRTFPHRDPAGDLEHLIELNVRWLGNLSIAFSFIPNFLEVAWMMNRLLTPTGNYSIKGSATLSWFKV